MNSQLCGPMSNVYVECCRWLINLLRVTSVYAEGSVFGAGSPNSVTKSSHDAISFFLISLNFERNVSSWPLALMSVVGVSLILLFVGELESMGFGFYIFSNDSFSLEICTPGPASIALRVSLISYRISWFK